MNTSSMKITVLGIAIATAFTLPALADDRGGRGMQFETFDADSNGLITAEEMAAHQKGRFDAIDADSNGQLSAAEITAHTESENSMRKERRAARMVEHLDTDGNGAVSLEEMSVRGPVTMFERVDVNKDGSIDAEEFSEMGRKGHKRGGGGGKRLEQDDS